MDKPNTFARSRSPILRYGCMALVSMFFALCVLCSGLYGTLMFAIGPVYFVFAVIMASMTALPYAALLRWLDHNEPEPRTLLFSAFLWGACVSTMLSLIGNETFGGYALELVQDEALADQLTASISAPIVEELTKGMGIVALFFLFRDEFDNVLDGIIYGAFIGLGFAWYENILYYVNASAEGGFFGMALLGWIRGVVCAAGGSHAAYTAIVGCSFGFIRVMRRGVLRWSLAPLFMFIAMFAHFAWNTFTSPLVEALSPGHPLGQLFLGLPFAVVVLQIPFTSMLLITVFVSWRHERKIIQKHLADVDADVVNEVELAVLSSGFRRNLEGVSVFFTRGPFQWFVHRKLRRHQVDLAFVRWHHAADRLDWDVDQDEDVVRICGQIRNIRAQLR